MNWCIKRKILKRIKHHMNHAIIRHNIYEFEGLYNSPFDPENYYRNKIEAKHRCIKRLKSLLLKKLKEK